MSKHAGLAAGTALAVLLAWAPTPAWAAPPAAPVLVSPADGSTATTTDLQLEVTATDPDGGSLNIRFEGREAGATVPGNGSGDPFTVVAVPDLQNYTYAGRQGTITQQAQWIVNTRPQLNTAMVVQLGDLVSEYDNLLQWDRTSTGLKVLDDARVPTTVIAGNHDFNPTTGDFTQYHAYFPPSRYAGKPWIPTTATYGGYLGQNLFGADPVDRGNMNNFALFSAGGRDFIVLNLEWEGPQYVLDWGARVLAAYPDRIAILTTHSFLQINGTRRTVAQRPGGIPAETMWNTFVSQQCSIRLVLSGHYHNGDLGEANRSDLNRCGQPVHQILTDYQDRANGGDGWLRYYTFDPVAGTMTATTYSPKLNQYETDADSSFTLPFPLGEPQPAPFVPISTVAVASGGTATTTWAGLAPDRLYEWRAVATDGATATTSATWTVRTPQSSDLVDDTFSRNVSNGWGAADGSHAWLTRSTSTSYSVDGSTGRITTPVSAGRGATLTGISATDLRITADVAMVQAATGSGSYASLMGRVKDNNSYRAKLRFAVGGGLTLTLVRYTGSETNLASTTLSGVTAGAGVPIRVRLELQGTGPTTLRAKAWRVGSTEPATWTLTTTDSTAALQAAGSVGVDTFTSSSATAASVMAFDRLTATGSGTTPPPQNTPPTAVIGNPQVDGLSVTLSGTGSGDTDGTITGHAWDFGDNTTGTGATTSHTYGAAGTYTVRLTVTDDDNATGTTTRQVTVEEPPTGGPLAQDAFGRTTSNGWGTADTGGAWSVSGATDRFSVSGGSGKQSLSAVGTTADSVLASVTSVSTDLRAAIAWSRTAAAGALYASLIPRRVSSATDYRCKVVVATGGSMKLSLVRRLNGAETTLTAVNISGITQAADQAYELACRAVPSGGGTRLTGKLWRSGTTEPAAWQATSDDSTAALQAAGGVAVSSYLSSAATTGVTLSVDNLVAVDPAP